MSKNIDQIKRFVKINELNAAADINLYDLLIKNETLSSSPDRIERMVSFRDNDLGNIVKHHQFQLESNECLTCENVLTCTSKINCIKNR